MLNAMRRRIPRSVLTRLLLVAVVVRALVPAGFMPAATADGPGLQYCGPAAAQLAALDDRASTVPASHELPDHSSGSSDRCPFALTPAAAPVPQFPAAFSLAPVAQTAPEFNPFVLSSRVDSRAHRPRGPPQSA